MAKPIQINEVKIAQGKEWAKGLTQDKFKYEFLKRHPYSDVIPGVDEWISREEPEGRGISGVAPETYVLGG